MPKRDATLWQSVVQAVASSSRVVPIVVPSGSIVGTFLITVGQDLDGWDWAWALIGLAMCSVSAFLLYMREIGLAGRLESSERQAGRLHVAMKDALQPVAELIAAMPAKNRRERRAELKNVATQAVGALTLLLKDVDRLRAVVYQLDKDGMSALAYAGRGNTPSPFLRGTDRGDYALQMVEEGRDWFEPDTATARNPAYAGSRSGYSTYISASIRTDADGFGMVTVDAPHAGDLVATDRQIVLLMADLLAIAFAEADRA